MIDRLKAMQKDFKETDKQFAQRLLITLPSWRKLKSGTVRPGAKTLPAILKACPGLVKFIQADNKISYPSISGHQAKEVN